MFKELGLDDDFRDLTSDDDAPPTPTSQQRKASTSSEKLFGDVGMLVSEERERTSNEHGDGDEDTNSQRSDNERREPADRPQRRGTMQAGKQSQPWYAKLAPRRPKVKTASSAPPPTVSSMQRLALIALIIAVVIPGFGHNSGRQKLEGGVDAGPIVSRQTTTVDVCLRWSQQGGK